MNVISYHKAGPEDIDVIIEMRIRFLVDFFGQQEETAVSTLGKELRNYFSKTIADGTYISWLAKDGETVVGAGGMILREQPGNFKLPFARVGYILSMYTVPAYRRKGISTELLNRLVESGKEQGLKFFELFATKEGEFVYAKNGFKKHSEPAYRKFID